MKVAMMGSGGIGGYFGARMAQAGADVSFIARGAHLDAMRKHGLRIDSPEMGDAHIAPVQATDDPAEVGAVDYVIMGVKLWDTEAAGHAIAPMLGPETTVLSLQNGVEGDDILASIVGEERLIAGVAFIGSAISAPGVIGHVGTMQRIVIGEREGGISPRIEALRDMLQKGGVMAEASEDIQRMLWEKFVFLVGLSSTTTLMRTTLGPVRENPESREFYLNVMRETVAVGRARGVNLPEDFADDRLAFSDGLPAEMNSSMHHDLQKGNRLELPWLAGTVVRYGRELGVPTPVCQTVYAALLPLADGS
jgi:2-dehydropantoate 2-reductase